MINPTPHKVRMAVNTKNMPQGSPTRKCAMKLVTTGLLKTMTVISPMVMYRRLKLRNTTDSPCSVP